MFERLHPYLRGPLRWWDPREQSQPPTSVGTLVIRNVDSLNTAQQQDVLALSRGAGRDLQIVSIASALVFPLVRGGAFLDGLYYRLNPVYFDLTHSDGRTERRRTMTY